MTPERQALTAFLADLDDQARAFLIGFGPDVLGRAVIADLRTRLAAQAFVVNAASEDTRPEQAP